MIAAFFAGLIVGFILGFIGMACCVLRAKDDHLNPSLKKENVRRSYSREI